MKRACPCADSKSSAMKRSLPEVVAWAGALDNRCRFGAWPADFPGGEPIPVAGFFATWTRDPLSDVDNLSGLAHE